MASGLGSPFSFCFVDLFCFVLFYVSPHGALSLCSFGKS